MPIIEIENVSKIFGNKASIQAAQKMLQEGASKETIVKDSGATVAVHDVNLEIYPGETFVIMGLSGSGKSTLVRMLNRLIEPTSGRILIDGQDITQASPQSLRQLRREKISMVFQNFGLFPHKTILENTEYGLEIKGVPADIRRQKAQAALDNADLLAYQDAYPNQLSGGMQQRVGLARALANDTEILLMDEAFSALDPLIRKDMQDELIDLQENLNQTIIFITHDLDEALRIGDRIALMRNGELVQVGSGEEILINPASGFVERFVEDVDLAKVLTAEHAMEMPDFTLQYETEGARVAYQRMRGHSYHFIVVLNRDKKLMGYVTDTDALRALSSQSDRYFASIDEVLQTDLPTLAPDTPVADIYELMNRSSMPLAVVDPDQKFLGIISRKMIIKALANEGGNDAK